MTAVERAELLAAYVGPPDREQLPFRVQKAVEADPRFAGDLGARVVRRKGRDVAAALTALARDESVAQIVIGRSGHGRWHELFRGSVVTSLLRRLRDADVHVIGDGTSHPDSP